MRDHDAPIVATMTVRPHPTDPDVVEVHTPEGTLYALQCSVHQWSSVPLASVSLVSGCPDCLKGADGERGHERYRVLHALMVA